VTVEPRRFREFYEVRGVACVVQEIKRKFVS
jgi:hypothetical protein